MKKVILSMLCALVLLPAAPVWAQQAGDDGVEYVYEEVEFRPHLFLEAGVGAQYTLGEARFKDQLSPNAQIALGYQLTSWLGGRLQVNGWQSRGGWNGYGNPSFTQAYKYKYVAPGIDVMLNLSNLILGWNPDRLFTLSVFAGGGANIAFDNQEVIAIARGLYDKTAYRLEYLWDGTRVLPYGRAGLQAAFRLNDRLSLSVEGNANILSDKYNSKRADNPDWYFNALVGVRVNLGPTYTSTALAPPAEVVEPVPMVQVERVEEPAPEPRPQQPQQQTIEPLRRDVFFLINRYDIRPVEQQKVREIAEYLHRYPRTRVTVTGYADAGTGNDQINDRLAAQRADAVLRELRDRYNIEGERIFYDYKGARIQPFEENNLNRVAICVAE
jgi:outer membrane protein OmpA-like peptidoglycan-associated protein